MKRLVCILLAAVVLPWQVASAAPLTLPTLTVIPSTVAPGASVSVSGQNFPPNITCSVTINTQPVGETVSGVAVQSNGTLSVSQIQIPSGTTPGNYTVSASCGGAPITAPLTVANAKLSFSPNPAAPGSTVLVSGSGFAPQSALTLKVTFNLSGGGTQPVTESVGADNQGNFANLSLPVPATTINSSYTVSIYQGTDTSPLVTGTLTVGQGTSISLSVSSLPTGAYSTFLVSGTGFLVGEKVDVSYVAKLTDNTTPQITGSATVQQNGTFSNVLLVVYQNTTPGTYTVTATGESSHRTASAQLIVTPAPTLTVAPTSAIAGSNVTVSGQYFSPGASVTVQATVPLTGGGAQTVLGNATADASGNFSVQIQVPAKAAANTVTLVASENFNGSTLQASTKLAISVLSPAIALIPSTVAPGNAIAVNGSGFLPGTAVAVSAPVTVNGSVQTLTANQTTDSSGSFSVPLVIPAGAADGTVTVTATQTSVASATANLTIQTGVPSPTSTPTPTPSPTPTASPSTPSLGFRFVRTLHHSVRAGQTNQIEAQATLTQALVIWVHVNFPTGRHFDYISKTDAQGHWVKTFRIPSGATNHYSNRVYVHFQLWNGKQTAKTFGSFLIKH